MPARAAAALAGPAWQHVKTPLYVNGAARVVVLSLSDDMLAQDLKPDRITRARFAVRDLLDQAGDARTALVAYAGAAFTVAPLTDDRRTVLNLLRVLRPDVMPVPGNDAAAGIAQAVALLEQAHVQGGEIVLVTDTADAAAIRAARAAHARGIRVDVLGIGTAAGAPVPRSDGGFESEGGQLHLARRDGSGRRTLRGAAARRQRRGGAGCAGSAGRACQPRRTRRGVARRRGVAAAHPAGAGGAGVPARLAARVRAAGSAGGDAGRARVGVGIAVGQPRPAGVAGPGSRGW